MSKCSETQCETTATENTCHSQPCGTSASECPVECVADMWKDSFFQAMRQAQIEILKAKIQKSWGPMLDKSADALLESMSACWESKLAEIRAAEASHGFKEKLRDIWLEKK